MSIAKAAAKAGRAASKAAGKIHEANVWIAKEFKNNVKDWMSRAWSSIKHYVKGVWNMVKWDIQWAHKNFKAIKDDIIGSWKWANAVQRKAMSRMALKSRPSANAKPAKIAVATLANWGTRYSDWSVSMPARKRD